MKSVLVATDLSSRSDRAVQRALRLAALLGLPCHIMAVVDNDQPEDIAETQRKLAEARLIRFVADEIVTGHNVKIEVVAGDPLVAIPDRADTLDASILVLGQHRMRLFLDLLRETTMERLVRSSLRPVLLVCDPADHDYEKVLAPVGFSPACAQALRVSRQIAPGAEIRSFHAVLTPFSGLTGEGPGSRMARTVRAEAEALRDLWQIENNLQDIGSATQIITGGLTEVLSRMAADKPDLMAVGAHLRSGINPYTLGNFVAELIRKPPCDLLVSRKAPLVSAP